MQQYPLKILIPKFKTPDTDLTFCYVATKNGEVLIVTLRRKPNRFERNMLG